MLLTSSLYWVPVGIFVFPLALVTVVQNVRGRGLTLWDWYFLFSVATTLLTAVSPGTDINHLLELDVAGVLVVGQRLAAPGGTAVSRVVLLLPLLFGAMVLVKNPEWHYVPPKNAHGQLEPNPDQFWFWEESAVTFPQLAAALPANPHLLTEDATPAVLLGQRPVVMDAFAFRILAANGAIDDQKLVERINRREFNAVILLRRLDNPQERLESFHFTPRVMEALRKTYRFDRQEGQYFIHLPAPDEKTPASRD
jgi:hypothetical protein